MVTSTTTLPAVALMSMSSEFTDVNNLVTPCRKEVSLNVSSVPATVTVNETRSSNAEGVDGVLEPDMENEATSKITPTNEHRAGAHTVGFLHTFTKLRFEGSSAAAIGTPSDLYDHSLRWGPSGVKATVTVDMIYPRQIHRR